VDILFEEVIFPTKLWYTLMFDAVDLFMP
jgi:hypothetical protein